jgi:rSAM/selenodomain-associated transferase 2
MATFGINAGARRAVPLESAFVWAAMSSFSITAIVPVLNEAANLQTMLATLKQDAFDAIIVVDGESSDESAAVARRAGIVVIRSARGRGRQMNVGAAHASTPVLLFLHADTRLPAGAVALIERALRDPDVVGGCFRLSFETTRSALLRFYGTMSQFETALTTFGDQAYFVRTAVFKAIGGFPDWPFLEDVQLRRDLRQRGSFVKLPSPVVTSARRFSGEGTVRRQLLNALILLLFHCGISAQRLARWYRAER